MPFELSTIETYRRREVLVEYLNSCVKARDWHAVSDAANDIRCVEVELRVLKELQNKDT